MDQRRHVQHMCNSKNCHRKTRKNAHFANYSNKNEDERNIITFIIRREMRVQAKEILIFMERDRGIFAGVPWNHILHALTLLLYRWLFLVLHHCSLNHFERCICLQFVLFNQKRAKKNNAHTKKDWNNRFGIVERTKIPIKKELRMREKPRETWIW